MCIRDRIYTHPTQTIDLTPHRHGAKFGGDGGSRACRHHERHENRPELLEDEKNKQPTHELGLPKVRQARRRLHDDEHADDGSDQGHERYRFHTGEQDLA